MDKAIDTVSIPDGDGVTYTLLGGARRVRVTSEPRRISGGYVVTVCWVSDDETQRLGDGSVHPAHRRGSSWEEPIVNIDGYHPFDAVHPAEGS